MFARYLQVRQELSFVNWQDFLYCLQFKNYRPFHDQIYLVSTV